jgi:hypothetical protein
MSDTHETPEGHDQSACPQCLAMVAQCQILGGIAAAIEKALDDGTFERLGREAAERREWACLEAIGAIVGKPRKGRR